jgi:hypothetical protein
MSALNQSRYKSTIAPIVTVLDMYGYAALDSLVKLVINLKEASVLFNCSVLVQEVFVGESIRVISGGIVQVDNRSYVWNGQNWIYVN